MHCSAQFLGRIVLLSGLLAVAAPESHAQFRIVDGCQLQTVCIPLNTPTGSSTPVSPLCWALPVLEDGWTLNAACIVSGDAEYQRETYSFSRGEEMLFVDKIKLSPRLGEDTTVQVAEDILVIPCNPQCRQNPMGEDFSPANRPPILIIDDVTFPTIFLDPTLGPQEFICAVFVPVDVLADFFEPILGSPFCLDWFACADLDANGTFYGQPATPDLNGDGCPDVCVEFSVPGRFVPHKGLDEKGAELLDFLLNRAEHGLTKINVYEPKTRSFFPPTTPDHPFFPDCPPLLPGMKPGESHNTRPWCFTIGKKIEK